MCENITLLEVENLVDEQSLKRKISIIEQEQKEKEQREKETQEELERQEEEDFEEYVDTLKVEKMAIAHKNPNFDLGLTPIKWIYSGLSDILIKDELETDRSSAIALEKMVLNDVNAIFNSTEFCYMLYFAETFYWYGYPDPETHHNFKHNSIYLQKKYQHVQLKNNYIIEFWFFPILLDNQDDPIYHKGSMKITCLYPTGYRKVRFQTFKWTEHAVD